VRNDDYLRWLDVWKLLQPIRVLWLDFELLWHGMQPRWRYLFEQFFQLQLIQINFIFDKSNDNFDFYDQDHEHVDQEQCYSYIDPESLYRWNVWWN
jgi:hypothetical protein